MGYITTISLGLVFGFSILVLHEVFSTPYWKIFIYSLAGIGLWVIVGLVSERAEMRRAERDKRRESRALRQRYKEWEQ